MKYLSLGLISDNLNRPIIFEFLRRVAETIAWNLNRNINNTDKSSK